MNTKQPKAIGSIRLLPSHWIKLRQVWRIKGGAWIEKSIDREYLKLIKETK